ncbi:MAG: tetratricopeptide repeat protein [Micropepsaceae bacterium]
MVFAVSLSLVMGGGPSVAQRDDGYGNCQSPPSSIKPEVRADACERYLAQPGHSAAELATAQHRLVRADFDLNDYPRVAVDVEYLIKLRGNSEDYRERAYLNLALERYKVALADFNTSIRMNPHSARALENRGFVYLRMQQPEPAIRDFTRAIQLQASSNTYSLRGLALMQLGRNDAALRDFDTALQIDPRNADAYRGRENLYESVMDYVQAYRNQQMAMQLEPNVAQDFATSGELLHHMGRDDEAIADYTRSIALDPSQSFFYNNRGNVWMARKDYARALTDFNKALSLAQYAAAFKNRGDSLEKLGQPARAIEDYTRAFERAPSLLTRIARANAYISLGPKSFEWAKVDLAQITATKKMDPALSFQVAVAFLRMGEGPEAYRNMEIVRRHADRFDSSPGHMYVHGLALKGVGRVDEGQAEINAARALDPAVDKWIVELKLPPDKSPPRAQIAVTPPVVAMDECNAGRNVTPGRRLAVCTAHLKGKIPKTARVAALYGRSNAYQALKQWSMAIADLNAVLKLDPTQSSAMSGVADVLVDKGDTAGALAAYTATLKAFPDDASQWVKRCWFRARFRLQLDEALRDCEHALVLEPGADYVYAYRGFAHLVRKEFAKAVKDYDVEFRQLVPGFPGNPMSLFGRGLAKLRLGDKAGAASDLAAAAQVEPGIAMQFAGWGLRP